MILSAKPPVLQLFWGVNTPIIVSKLSFILGEQFFSPISKVWGAHVSPGPYSRVTPLFPNRYRLCQLHLTGSEAFLSPFWARSHSIRTHFSDLLGREKRGEVRGFLFLILSLLFLDFSYFHPNLWFPSSCQGEIRESNYSKIRKGRKVSFFKAESIFLLVRKLGEFYYL